MRGISTRIVDSRLVAAGGSALDTINGSICDLSLCQLAGTAADITVDAASTLNIGMNQYDPTAIAVAGTLNLAQDCSDLGVSQLAAGSWAAPAPPVSMLTALDRMAAAVANVIGFPIP